MITVQVIKDVAGDHPIDVLWADPDYFGIWPCDAMFKPEVIGFKAGVVQWGQRSNDHWQNHHSPLATFKRSNRMDAKALMNVTGITDSNPKWEAKRGKVREIVHVKCSACSEELTITVGEDYWVFALTNTETTWQDKTVPLKMVICSMFIATHVGSIQMMRGRYQI